MVAKKALRVLVASDREEERREICQRLAFFNRAGFLRGFDSIRVEVIEAPDNATAWDVLRRINVDAVIIDLHHPKGSGPILARQLRFSPQHAKIPVGGCTHGDADLTGAYVRLACQVFSAEMPLVEETERFLREAMRRRGVLV